MVQNLFKSQKHICEITVLVHHIMDAKYSMTKLF